MLLPNTLPLALCLWLTGQGLLAQDFDRNRLNGSGTVVVEGSSGSTGGLGGGAAHHPSPYDSQASENEGTGSGGGQSPKRAALTPQAQLDCLKAILAALAVARDGGTVGSPAGMDAARAVESSNQMAIDALITNVAARADELRSALARQVAHSSFNWAPAGNVPTGLLIEVPEGVGGGPLLFDAQTNGSLAWVATISAIELAKLRGDGTMGPFVAAILAKKPATYQTFVRCLLGDKMIDALQWDEGACKTFVINHERAHAILNDTSTCTLTGEARAEKMFDRKKDGKANLDGLALTMTLADLGKSQHEELARIAAALGGTIGESLSLAAEKNLC